MRLAKSIAITMAFAVVVVACGSASEEVADEAAESLTEAADAGEDVAEAAEDVADAGEDVAEAAEDVADAGEDVAEAAEDASEAVSAGGEPVAVSLVEWAVVAPTSFAAGGVTFTATNDGNFPHELAVFRGDSYEALPLLANGEVDEATLGVDVIGRTERIASGDSADLTLTLEPGNYVLVCNIAAGPNSHAAAGQVLSVTVEG